MLYRVLVRIEGWCFKISESEPKPKRKLSLTEKIALVGLVLTIITGVYFPIAIHNNYPPFSSAPLYIAPPYQPVVQDVYLNEEYETLLESDLTIINDDWPVLDITVLNNGSEPLVFTRAAFSADKIWKIAPEPVNKTLPLSYKFISGTYNVTLPVTNQEIFSVSVKMSQTLEPDEIDRFAFILYNDADSISLFIVRLTVELITFDEKSIVIPNLMLLANRPGFEFKTSLLYSDQIRLVAQEIENTNGTKTDGLTQLTNAVPGS